MHKDVAPHEAAILNTPAHISNPVGLGVPNGVGVTLSAVASSTFFQNITFSGVPGSPPFSLVGTGQGALMQIASDPAFPFASPAPQAEFYTLRILFQYSEIEGGPLLNGVIPFDPAQEGVRNGEVIFSALASQDQSANDPNGVLLMIVLNSTT